ncbi:glycoside hydrolase family 88 protein [Dactylonectria macrodidyma]|uniref:Glycoside hydrolase family 88 protein n=1 Tax=Dactylonectria macrodidyma TaxID=307937 RepID=A0A9P9J8J0_9HYPO|nr:glycoside hydrolase family 88 protein [Dactylonectria macrodidyma]
MVMNDTGGLRHAVPKDVPPYVNGCKDSAPSSTVEEITNEEARQTAPQIDDATSVVPHIQTNGVTSSKKPLWDLLYSADVYAKIWNVASQAFDMSRPPVLYPEYTKPNGTKYVYREGDFWTSGFFPGCLYLLLERERKFKSKLQSPLDETVDTPHQMHLEFACKWWTANLHQNSSLSTTHDLGFMIFPWAQLAWELDHDALALDTIVRASRTLASRYVPQVGAIRSWDTCITKRYAFTDPKADFLFIIDNMMNLNMLFWTASQLNDKELYQIALNHARKSQEYHVRADFSTTHLIVLDPDTGAFKSRLTNQGFSDESSWARGQAWAIAGFAQTFRWTQDESFLKTAQSCADYFLKLLPAEGIPPWDFCAPKDTQQPPDTSAAVIAVYGLLLLHEARLERGEKSVYFDRAIDILKAVCSKYLNTPHKFVTSKCVIDTVETVLHENPVRFSMKPADLPETILGGATINNYEFAPRRWANHGLVYADYYFLLAGNKLLEMRGVESIKDLFI